MFLARFFWRVFFNVSISIPRLSELLSDLVWRIVGDALSDDIVVKYLASDEPFQKRLGEQEGDGGESGEWSVDPVVEALCDTLWGVDAMVSARTEREGGVLILRAVIVDLAHVCCDAGGTEGGKEGGREYAGDLSPAGQG